jgi:AAA+ ATPase superfamily predicted ATPase
MSEFIGRERELAVLEGQLDRVRQGSDRPGRALLVRGRRRVGKSRLLEEFIARSGVPAVFFTASRQSPERELALFADAVAESSLPGAATFQDVTPATWEAALRLLANAMPTDEPCIVVLDELPYLTAGDPAIEGTLQKIFDKVLSRHRVLLIGVGSDLAMMEALNAYGRPFHQRASEMVVPPLSPSETAVMLDLGAADALDAYLITGGLPLIADEWPTGMRMWEYLERAIADSTSALVVSGERMLAAEFPAATQARAVLTTIGSGERTFTAIANAAGVQAASLERALAVLIDTRVVARTLPLSTVKSRESRYYVADPYLRFWLSFIGPALPEIERGAGARVLARLRSRWQSWRGQAIEPVVREGVERMGAAGPAGAAGVVGGYWTRSNDPEIDLVIADRSPTATAVNAVGSIKWLESAPFDAHDLGRLIAHRSQLPGATADTPLVAVSRSGFAVEGVVRVTPEDLLAAW